MLNVTKKEITRVKVWEYNESHITSVWNTVRSTTYENKINKNLFNGIFFIFGVGGPLNIPIWYGIILEEFRG